ncbi:MAG: hypothetical protein H6715_00875 [Myxococcales bacterium]|nr:hypothetical protein [Myxococcales bacterium]
MPSAIAISPKALKMAKQKGRRGRYTCARFATRESKAEVAWSELRRSIRGAPMNE